MADPSRSDARQEIRDEAERTLAKDFTKRDRPRSKKPTKVYKEAAVNLGRVDLWTWLSQVLGRAVSQPREPAAPAVAAPPEQPRIPEPREPETDGARTVESTHALAEHLEKVVLPELLELAPAEGLKSEEELKKTLTDHFWCELLAQLARALRAKLTFVDANIQRVTDWICTSREGEARVPVPQPLVRAAVRSTWQHLEKLVAPPLATLTGPTALLTVRLLAIAICKAPEKHETVAKYCLDPLTKTMRRLVQRYLLDALGERWLPETAMLNANGS